MLGQRIATESFHRAGLGEFQHAQEIPFQVRPAELSFALVILQIGAEPITAQDSLEHGSQQAGQNPAAAGDRYCVDHVPRRHKGPQETLSAAGPPARLIGVQHWLIRQLLFQFLTRGGYGCTGFFPALLRTSQADLDSQNLRQQRFHPAPGQATDHRQIGDQSGQLRSKVSSNLFRQWCPGPFFAVATYHVRELILGDLGADGWYFGDLMPSRLSLRSYSVWILRQLFSAVPALMGQPYLN